MHERIVTETSPGIEVPCVLRVRRLIVADGTIAQGDQSCQQRQQDHHDRSDPPGIHSKTTIWSRRRCVGHFHLTVSGSSCASGITTEQNPWSQHHRILPSPTILARYEAGSHPAPGHHHACPERVERSRPYASLANEESRTPIVRGLRPRAASMVRSPPPPAA